MKAIVQEKYGSPEVLKLKEVEKPVPKNNEALVKICAASINSWDWDKLTGKPFEYRIVSGIINPKHKIPGCDIAGIIEAVGKDVKKFKPGDKVHGDLSEGNWGGFAEYTCAREDQLTIKPEKMTFEEASAVPQAGLLALQAVEFKKDIKESDKILINGACGGVGTFAIQMLAPFKAEITGVDRAEKSGAMKSLGARYTIDHIKDDFTKNGKKYDFIIDVKSDRSVFDYKRALNTNGIYVTAGGKTSSILQIVFLGPLIKKTENKTISIIIHKPNKGLNMINEMFLSGRIKPVIDRRYPLKETAEAFRYFGEGKFKGKIVVTI